MPHLTVFDTTVFVQALRDPARRAALRRLSLRPHCFMTAVTVAELYAGARTREQQTAVAQFVAVFARFNRVLVPSAADWAAAGRLIAHARWRRGDMEPRDHYPDVLIAQVASRIGATIITANVADFRRWVRVGHLDARVQSERGSP